MEITAQMVKELREKTGAGMMDCKKALVESNGDFEAATDFLRKKGLAAAGKKAGRIASEGAISGKVLDDGKTGAVVEVNCETDFVARSDGFREFSSSLLDHLLAKRPADVEALKTQSFTGDPSQTVEQAVTALIAKLGENQSVRRFEIWTATNPGLLHLYIHGAGKIGVLVEVGCGKPESLKHEGLHTFAKQVAMQIAALSPIAVRPEEVSAETVEREKAIYLDVVKQEGKPEKMWENIVKGKLSKFFQEAVLLDQEWVHEQKTKVRQAMAAAGKVVGDEIVVRRFLRFQLGEGLQKRSNDLAAEVAAQLEGKK